MGKKFDPLAVIAAAAKQAGLEVPDFTQLDEARREADSVVLYIESPAKFREAECRQCHRYFATNYAAVAMCSDKCRREYLHNLGIPYNPHGKTPEERWGGSIPVTVPPDALLVAKWALEQQQESPAAAQ